MSSSSILAGLNTDQLCAATAGRNAVVAAGAGSGKTKTLAARYAWLVMEKGLKPEEILTLTFTNKAANEMYDRIYGILAAEKDDARARAAITDFYKARISTLDSFCAGIVRTAARRYGIAPDFIIDNAGVRDLAREAALPFVLNNRENPALRTLLAGRNVRAVAEDLFAEAALTYGFAIPEDGFAVFLRNQEEKIRGDWRLKIRAAEDCTRGIAQELESHAKIQTAAVTELREIFREHPAVPDPQPFFGSSSPEEENRVRKQFRAYFDFLFRLKNVDLNEGAKGKDFAILREYRKDLKDTLFSELEALANSMLQRDITAAVFSLLEKFLAETNVRKRQAGILSFADVAQLAVDALKRYPDIRGVYKDSIKAIMIDEFQDNNGLQRDLIFLLAEKAERREEGVPLPEELEDGKMFFVGDEKQSIYRFRGADVAVFRSLATTLGNRLNLRTNYRSLPPLIDAFNRIFGGEESESSAPAVFLPDSESLPAFEAAYTPMQPPDTAPSSASGQLLHFAFLDKGRLPEDDITAPELEAAFIVKRIKEMKESGGCTVYNDDGTTRPCGWKDFAVLQRRYTHQRYLEKYCKDFGVPFVTDRPEGLFTDAPINDLVMLLRLLVYPKDRLAYAAVIRSPFARLGDASLALCMLDKDGEPFREELAESLPEEERHAYLCAGRRYRVLAEEAKTLSLTQLAVRLWYDEGLRYETLWSAPAQVYTQLFEVFFKLAQEEEARGKTLPAFLDYLEELIAKEEKLDDLDIPGEEGDGIRIMSIHKSKGLEFPVVFIYDGASAGRSDTNSQPIYFHENWGVTINLPLAEELPEKGGNYFYLLQQEEEKQKSLAELRRLLYVAMTRAESCLYFTASLPEQTKEEKKKQDLSEEEYTETFLRERLRLLENKNREKGEEKTRASFLDLLLPAVTADENYFTVEVIPILSRRELSRLAAGREGRAQREAALIAAARYAETPAITPSPEPLSVIPASKLHCAAAMRAETPVQSQSLDALDAILEKVGLEAADFGTIVHGFLEERMAGRPPLIPPKMLSRIDDEKHAGEIRAAAEKMTQGFLDSDLGKKSLAASFREVEFSVLTCTADKNTVIAGKIDLLFEAEGSMHVVDFKTDSEEDPRRHIGQLAVYARAAADIFGKPVQAWLFYLRSGRARELTKETAEANIEEMAAAYIEEAGASAAKR
ncbi:MAG: UvrD-helicase domain-containing protein [Spirochaetaceae bacterium]|nr:UvrD-helicase domain-containing protein [Spirochaetaceae bacterium]